LLSPRQPLQQRTLHLGLELINESIGHGDQVHVVGHEAIDQDGHAGLGAAARHEGLIGAVVIVGEEAALTSVPALGDVLRDL
jgi:hypothetical protein